MGAKTKTVERGSQATPFSEDVLSILTQHLNVNPGEAGMTPLSPLQREAGTGIRQTVDALSRGPGGLLGSIPQIHQREMDRSAAGMREAFSGMGGRFGTPLMREEGRMRREGAMDMSMMMGGLEQQHAGQLMQGLAQMFGMGEAGMAPFLQMAGMGIVPDEVIAQPNPWAQFGTALVGGAGSALQGRWGGGGGGPSINFGG